MFQVCYSWCQVGFNPSWVPEACSEPLRTPRKVTAWSLSWPTIPPSRPCRPQAGFGLVINMNSMALKCNMIRVVATLRGGLRSQNLSKPVYNLRAVPLRVRVPTGLRRNSWAISLHRIPLAIFVLPIHWNNDDEVNNKSIFSYTINIMTINKLERTIIGLKRENPSWNSLSNNLWQQGDRLPW